MRSFKSKPVAQSDVAEDAPVDPAVVIKKLNGHLIPWLFSLGILCYLDRTNLSFAALDLNRDLRLSCSTYGLGAALFFVSYALFQMPSTAICTRLGAHVWLSANIVAWGTVAACFSLARGIPSFLALRFLLGVTECAAFPGMWYHLSVFYSEAELGPAYAKVASCTALAAVVGAPLAAGILAMDGTAGLRGWQWLFILEGLATVAFGCVLRFTLAPSPSKARMLTHTEREWLTQRQEAAKVAAAGRQAPHVLPRHGGGTCGGMLQQLGGALRVARDWRILYLAACWLLIAAVMFAMQFFLPLLVAAMFSGGGISGSGAAGSHGACSSGDDHGGDTPAAAPDSQQHSSLVALASAIPFIVAAIGMNINARLAGQANERHRHAGAPIMLAGLALGLVPLAARAGPGLAFVLLSAAVGLCWSFHGPFFSWPAVFLSSEQAAAGFALINSLGAVGGFIGPYLLGLLSDRGAGGFATAMMVLAGFLLAAGALILAFPAPGRSEEQEVVLKSSDSAELLPDEEEGGDALEVRRSAGWEAAQQHRPRSGASAGQSSESGELECQPILKGNGSHLA